MKKTMAFTKLLFLALLTLSLNACMGFDDEPHVTYNINFQEFQLEPESYWNGSDGFGSVTLHSTTFYNYYEENEWGEYWEGFAFSNITDIETQGYENQYSAYVKGGGSPINIYSIAYVNEESASIFFPINANPLSIAITNSTWAYLSMLNGDTFAKKFEEGDWFLLTIKGFDKNDTEIGAVEFYLADLRPPKNLIIDQWTPVDLRSLRGVRKLVFSLSSSDTGDFGMNTPSYFCLDGFLVEFLL